MSKEKKKVVKKRSFLCRICSVLMACTLLVSFGMPVSAATARATTMKLEKTEGTVTLKTQNGTKRKITNGMRLYNGNSVTTASDSYAYISLDSSKAVKLDEKSSVTLSQSGKKLELLVKTGKLFFNVSSPLTDEESMNIRTSTMVTGVRGTCGVVEKVNPAISKLYLIEGKVTLGSGSNATTVFGGQTATVVLSEKQEQPGETDKPGEAEQKYQVTVEKMTEKDVPVFAITEILNNKELQEKIEKTTDLKIEKLEKVLEESLNPTDPDEDDSQEESTDESTGDDSQEENTDESTGDDSQEENTDESTGDDTQQTTPVHPHYPWKPNTGDTNTGDNETGDTNKEEIPAEETTSGDKETGSTTPEETPADETTSGDKETGSTTPEEIPADETTSNDDTA